VLYGFKSGDDGANPYAGLLNIKGKLYGTNILGGANVFGTVFSSARLARKRCSTALAARETVKTRTRASSTSRASSTARPMRGAQTAMEPSSRNADALTFFTQGYDDAADKLTPWRI